MRMVNTLIGMNECEIPGACHVVLSKSYFHPRHCYSAQGPPWLLACLFINVTKALMIAHPHCLICQHNAEHLWAWQLDWAQRGHSSASSAASTGKRHGGERMWDAAVLDCGEGTGGGGQIKLPAGTSALVPNLNPKQPACDLGLWPSRKAMFGYG